MNIQNGAPASTDPACLKKAIELFFVIHPNAHQPLLGPFQTATEAECACGLISSPDATVEARTVDSTDDFIHGHRIKNAQVSRVFLGIATQGRHA